MTNELFCSRETELVQLLSGGKDLPFEWTGHLAACKACRGVSTVFALLQKIPESTAPLPSADAILWRAQIAQRVQLAARATAGIELVRKLGLAIGAMITVTACLLSGLSGLVLTEIAGVAAFALATLVFLSLQTDL